MVNDILKEWLINLLSGLVSFPNDIVINEKKDEIGLLYIVKVNAADQGKVIGKKGKIADAIRTLLRAAGYLTDVKTSMKVDTGSAFELKEEN